VEDAERVLGRLARVHDDGLLHPPREADALAEDPRLRVARRAVVVEVEPDLTDGDDARVPRELLELGEKLVGPDLRVVRVQADGGPDVGPALGDGDRVARGLERVADADRDERADALGPGARE